MNVQRSFGAGTTGTLYLVGTPIGNLEDMTFRAVRVLQEVDLIAAEDTRQTRKLLTHYEIQTRLVSYHEHNKQASGSELVRLLLDGQHIALVSDAGLPAISDPGSDLVVAAAEAGIPVVPVPGANAALSALIVSALPTERFTFAGFPPREKKRLQPWLEELAVQEGTLLLYESPHRLQKTLQAIAVAWGNRQMAMVRELTKRYEEVVRGTVQECLERLDEHPPQGEYVLVLAGAEHQLPDGAESPRAGDVTWWSPLSLEAHVRHYEELTGDRKEAMRRTAQDRGLPRREVYNTLMKKHDEEDQ
ncbi:16S rRNA (cytidine(1402)-2'-O)-methyltransferase [Paenibacillus daejeonensis]|uniref:16S rRNA (cytidine(1402)-2'-O)-methyltransferase n=1 Tax=Paenibacillus daejeonensis TaxID=135193 RepID=UPI0003809462|nr:16S rRNA (cytidine(1402)-2'-O)-methyltransferase [Paenibacillus daejeonensis]